ncbi:hypothetical protein BV22DRAFT_762967 [Leucogyrophana mollusca]|uniref:Uncharacterized protein n=1 Tax=Leucogyrophana mollusca TaxID=85980 RepID=A0ACB8B6F5_9AGAM|nr:hypothetical protein BV22DRAFT_762967 [Leucogyrophana mollusca]
MLSGGFRDVTRFRTFTRTRMPNIAHGPRCLPITGSDMTPLNSRSCEFWLGFTDISQASSALSRWPRRRQSRAPRSWPALDCLAAAVPDDHRTLRGQPASCQDGDETFRALAGQAMESQDTEEFSVAEMSDSAVMLHRAQPMSLTAVVAMCERSDSLQ